MEKLVINGHVAVLISPSYGAGWYTWNNAKEGSEALLFHPELVNLVEENRASLITQELVEKLTGVKDVYVGNPEDLVIVWVKKGTTFDVLEYDGAESLLTDLPIKA